MTMTRTTKAMTSGADNDKQSENNGAENVITKTPVTGFPPAHAIATVIVLSGTALLSFPSLELVDQLATAETISRPLFPQYLNSVQLGLIRWFFVAVVFGTGLPMAFGPGYTRYTDYLPASKLKKKVPLHIKGIKTTYSFTSWCWYLLGLHFAASGTIPLWKYFSSSAVPRWLIRWTTLSFHLAAPCAMLVSCIVRYVLWPNAIKNGKSTANYKSTVALRSHNANVGMVLLETAVLGGGVPVTLHLLSLPTLLGCTYLVFAWMVRFQWSSGTTKEAHFIYFFFDTTLPGLFASMAVVGLWVVLLVFYFLFYAASHLLFTGASTIATKSGEEPQEPVLGYNVAAMVVMLSLLCRFRD